MTSRASSARHAAFRAFTVTLVLVGLAVCWELYRYVWSSAGKRTDLDGVKGVCMALQQAERYGTPLGNALRVMAQENRDMRMSEAEKKAASLPPKLTVPMILFFLPVLFVVILGPAAIKVMAIQ